VRRADPRRSLLLLGRRLPLSTLFPYTTLFRSRQVQVVAVHGDVEGAAGHGPRLHLLDALGQPAGERGAARGDAQQGDVLGALGALQYLVRDPGQRAPDLGALQDGPQGAPLGWTRSRITFRAFSCTQSSDPLPCLTEQVVKRMSIGFTLPAAPRRAAHASPANIGLL